ncbi:uncharacterized protein LOC123674154 isoform X2 [Harmonia axyridis]|uniref:uncharacterized protein LOC123674154 isoform X2 n=1 Tax=Harmonia axyridis TaxID=115357 RepID=UPI001E27582A|nr:uncharacterized protein LOC123674154 isoform X2 [Harmonia axyridis]
MDKELLKSAAEKQSKRNCNAVRSSRRNRTELTFDGTEKRKRSSNFHSQEIESLLSLIDEEKSIIECKKTDQLTNSYKDRIWNIVSQIFNQKNTTKRSDKQLRSKWETLKKIARKEYASGSLSQISGKVLEIMLSCGEPCLETPKSEIHLKFKEEPYFDDVEKSTDEHSDDWNQEIDHGIFQMKSGNQPSTQRKIISSSENSLEVNNINLSRRPIASVVMETNLADPELCNMPTTPQIEQESNSTKNKATQCDPQELGKNTKKKLRYIDTSFHNFGKIFFKEENKRKRDKHQLEMEILKVELSIKKRQLENLIS